MIAIQNAEDGWFVESRDGLDGKAKRERVVLWVAVSDPRTGGVGVAPFVHRDGALVAAQSGKLMHARDGAQLR